MIRVATKSLHASAAAKVVSLASKLDLLACRRRIDIHPADRIFFFGGYRAWRIGRLGNSDAHQRRRNWLADKLLRILLKLLHAVLAAEIVCLAFMLQVPGGRRRIYRHPADGINVSYSGCVDVV